MEYGRSRTHASVAWYKLADLITRKEREKALSVYRLLSHSLEDRAYALQLEGDILWSFDDRGACEKYKQAAFLYRKEKRWIDAIAVCEHLLFLEPNNFDLLSLLVDLYAIIAWQNKFSQHLGKLTDLLQKKIINDEQLLKTIKAVIDYARTVEHAENCDWIYENFHALAQESPAPLSTHIKEYLK